MCIKDLWMTLGRSTIRVVKDVVSSRPSGTVGNASNVILVFQPTIYFLPSLHSFVDLTNLYRLGG